MYNNYVARAEQDNSNNVPINPAFIRASESLRRAASSLAGAAIAAAARRGEPFEIPALSIYIAPHPDSDKK